MEFNEIIANLPAPYYRDNQADIVIYNADCREILPQIPEGSVDLVLTDPPYGNGTDYISYEDTTDNLKEMVSQVFPLILAKSQTILVTCGVANINIYPTPRWILSWINKAGTGSGPWGFCCWQPILAYGKDPYLSAGVGRRPDVIDKNEISGKFIEHPCPKPVDLWQLIILRGSVNKSDLILDPFLGSGTTAYCAKKLGRKCIGIEIEEKYCEIAAKRLSQGVLEMITH